MKYVYTLLVTLLYCTFVYSQSFQWTWMTGSNTVRQGPVYGSQGVPAAGNTPGARDGAGFCTDNNGNFWIFGGSGQWDNPLGNGALNDLWKFNPSTGRWTWVSGDLTFNPPGSSGPFNSPSTSYRPQGRLFCSMWCDKQGNLWVFGGYFGNNSKLGDLWKFNPSTSEWTLVAPASTSNPPPTNRATSWTDNNGIFWLYGGDGSFGAIDGLWKFDPASLEWTLVNGGYSPYFYSGPIGSFGTQGVAAATNTPGPREAAASWVDKDNNLWLFGGTPYFDLYNDLWKYSPITNQWTWMSGSNSSGAATVFGTQGTASPGNTPGARSASIGFHTTDGKLWLFSGIGNTAVPGLSSGLLNELWSYDIGTGLWTWMAGETALEPPGVYGTQGISAPGDEPGGRYYSSGWGDANNHIWVFGGSGYASQAGTPGVNNDLWEYMPQLKITLAGISTTPFCAGGASEISYTATGTFPAGNQFIAQLSDATGSFSEPIPIGSITSVSSGVIYVTTPSTLPTGTGYRIRVVSSATGTVSADNGADLTIYGKPMVSITATTTTTDLCPGTSVQLSATAADGSTPYNYQWSTGSTGAALNFVPPADTTLRVTVLDGCSATAVDSIRLTVYQQHPPQLSGKPVLCPGTTETLNAHGGYSSYAWQDGSTDSTLLVSQPGQYAVSVSDKCGSTFNATIDISLDTPPVGFLPADTAICSYADLVIAAKQRYSDYRWSTGETTASITVSTPGVYTLEINDRAGCPASDTIVVENKDCFIGFRMPTAFSPNGDGHNDILKPLVFGRLVRFHWAVYNRYGGKVFESGDPSTGWNGATPSGDPTMAGTYVWTCEYQFTGDRPQFEKGTVILIR